MPGAGGSSAIEPDATIATMSATPGAAMPAAPAAPTSGGACGQPGCTGTIADGYCNVCGSPAVPGARVAEASALAESQPLSGREGTSATAASRVQSAAIGSKRAGSTGTGATRRTRTGSQRMRTARIGAGLTAVPPAPPVDAAKAIMANPEVPENKRSCSKCGKGVGRSIDGQPGRSEGFCPNCGQPFSFTPKLQPGDLVTVDCGATRLPGLTESVPVRPEIGAVMRA